ncbi:3-oxoacyl-ACP synthase III [Botrimarina hoheduenensis]|uniref:3-oxoacyl-[acyl-carrier-protein] synthase 3 n=1 Tax=Botrimarina hoheduenensis TaxID=2528000 RepID=A0A5C5WDA9_9BACT|nr:3-oxoacyl-ACP synthase III [Botrimarina hoheduenensis]TWT48654.1 3-oxoacyl-[acyl-carrier-protein] synthase 3 [Botrimarina hoheduenensis]
MLYKNVRIASIAHVLPEEIVSSSKIEQRLSPLYARLKLPEGRLELMSGIRERRFYPVGTLPGDVSLRTAAAALSSSGLAPDRIGACLHGSVCRDCLEPATACRVHHALQLPHHCVVQDVSNACLGILSGAAQIATLIEAGQIEAGIVVGTETGRALVENTIVRLNADKTLTRDSIKNSLASLTIGSASAAIVLCRADMTDRGGRLVAATAYADTTHHELCRSEGLSQVMHTDSERLMRAGVNAGCQNFQRLLEVTGWSRDDINRTFCHQVGSAHRKLMLSELGLPLERDYATLEWLGNTGSAALPATLSIGIEQGLLSDGDQIALLGIGSGVNCLMMAVRWGVH